MDTNKILPVLYAGMAGMIGWLLLLMRHEDRVRSYMCDCGLPCQGIDWQWADPKCTGQNAMFSIPWPRNLRTGEVIQVPFMGL